MSWGEIKYALNSSVGNANFRPLNEMVEYQLFPGDGVVNSWFSNQESITSTKKHKTIKFGIGGRCRISFLLSGYTVSQSTFHGTIRISLNGNEIYTLGNQTSGISINYNGGTTFQTDIIDVSDGDVVIVEFEDLSGNFRTIGISDLSIRGSVLPKHTFVEVD